MIRNLWVPLALLAPMIAEAAEIGSIRGTVVDVNGTPVEGAEIIVSGSGIAGELQTVSGKDGSFRFLAVPAGTHDVLVIADNVPPVSLTVEVSLDRTSYIPVAFRAADDTEVMVVESARPVIDGTRSSFSNSLSEDLLQNLPVGRSYQDAVAMLPGVSGRTDSSKGGPSDGNPSVRGEGQYGNNYSVDGVSTRDPATKTFGSNVNFDAIQDIQVYTDGAPAEFGQFAGMLVNVAIKDGGDEHHGIAGLYLSTDASFGKYDIVDLETHEEVPTAKRRFQTPTLSLTAGGPILKEKLWYFGAVDLGMGEQVFEGMNPDTPYRTRNGSLLAKVSWFITPDLTLRYMFNGELSRTINEQTSSQFLPESQSKRLAGTMSHLLTGEWRPDALTQIELKAGYWQFSLNVVPMSGDEDTPTIIDLDSGKYLQNWTDFDFNDRTRIGGGLYATRLVNRALGKHKFKAGFETWAVGDTRELKYTGAEGGRKYYATESGGFPCETGDYSDCYEYYEYADVGPLGHRGLLMSAFLQDDWQPHKNLTLNVGVRYDRETLFQNDKNVVYLDDRETPEGPEVDQIPFAMNMIAPRLGVAWDITGDNKTVATVNAGRYYDISGNSMADWADNRSAYGYSLYENNPETGEYDLIWEQSASPLLFDSKLKPAHLDKLTVGVEREIVPLFSLGLRGILSTTRNIPEDVNTNDYDWYIMNSAVKQRDYRAIELVAEKKYDGVWQLLGSYTLSESKGHTPGQFETPSGGSFGSDGNQVGVYLDDVADQDVRAEYFDVGDGGYLDGLNGLGTPDNPAGWYGYLPYHSFHQVKINGSYTAPWGSTVGLVYEFDSGHAWQKRTYVDLYGDYNGFAEGRGSRFMPAVHYVDLRLSHRFKMPKDRGLELSLDVFNLLDLEQVVTNYENDDENFGLALYRQAPRSVRAGLKFNY